MAVPAAPDVTVTTAGDHLAVAWLPNEDDLTTPDDDAPYVSNVTSWEVERSADGETGWAQVKDEADEHIFTYEDTDADTADTEYFYRVRGVNGEGNGDYSAVASATTLDTPTAPTTIAAEVQLLDILVSWALPAADHTALELQFNEDAGGYEDLVTLPAGQTEYMHSGLTPGSDYLYRIRAVNEVGNSAYDTLGGAVTSLTTLPDPTTDMATESTVTGITVTWTANELVNVDNHEIQRSADNGRTWTSLSVTLASDAEEYLDTTTDPGVHYWYRTRVLWSTANSVWSDVVFGIGGGLEALDGYRPNTPRRLTATAASSTSIALTWADCSVVEEGYSVQRKLSSSSTWGNNVNLPVDTQSYTYTNLLIGTQYDFRVRARGTPTPSEWTPTVSASTSTNGAGTAPAAPTGLELALHPPRSATIMATWTDNSNNETGFEVQWWNINNPNAKESAQLGANEESLYIAWVNDNNTYAVRVKAFNDFGSSAWSNTATIFVGPVQAIAYPPLNLRQTAVTETSVTMAWNDANVTGATDYFRVERSLVSINGPWVDIAHVGGGQTGSAVYGYMDTTLSNGIDVWYRVKSFVSGYGLSEASNVLATMTTSGYPEELDPPTNVAASTPKVGTVKITWSYPFVQSNHTGFKIYRSIV